MNKKEGFGFAAADRSRIIPADEWDGAPGGSNSDSGKRKNPFKPLMQITEKKWKTAESVFTIINREGRSRGLRKQPTRARFVRGTVDPEIGLCPSTGTHEADDAKNSVWEDEARMSYCGRRRTGRTNGGGMKTALRLLYITPSDEDVRSVTDAFGRAGQEAVIHKIETPEAYQEALAGGPWDAVIAEFRVPGFKAPAGLAPLSAAHPDLPYIVLAGHVGEEAVAACFKAGASDYVPRASVDRIVSVVKRQVRRARARRKRREDEEAFEQSERKFRVLFDSAGDIIYISDFSGKIIDANKIACVRYGYTRLELLKKTILDLDPDETSDGIRERMERIKRLGGCVFERVHRTRSGGRIPVEVSTRIIEFAGRKAVLSIVRDIRDRKLALQALRESEERFRLLAENSLAGICISTGNTVLFANRALLQMFGYDSFENFVMIPLTDHAAPYAREFLRERLDKIERGEAVPPTFEFDIIRRDGAVRTLAAAGTHYREAGLLVCQTTFQDITERKRMEETLRLREAQLNNAMKIARLGDWEYDVATDTFTFNDNFFAIFGTTAEKAGGYTMRSYDYVRRFLHPDDRDLVAIETKKALETEDPAYSRMLEHRIIMDDGSIGYISVRIFIVKDEYGRTVKTYGVNQNITWRKKIEEAFRLVSMRYEAILSSVPDIIMETNTAKIYTWANDAGLAFFGNDVIGREASYYFEGEQDTYERVAPLFQGMEDTVYVESWQRRCDGERRLLAWWCRVLKDEDGVVTGVLSTARDITEQKRTERDLRWELSVNAALARLSAALIDPESTIAEASRIVLDHALALTSSAAGYVALFDPSSGEYRIESARGGCVSPETEASGMPRAPFREPADCASNMQRAFFTNAPASHLPADGRTDGLPGAGRFLVVPLFSGSEMIGRIALADAARDYTEKDVDAVKRMADIFALAVRSKRADERVRASLAEKTLLIKEIHHRIKNNLQVVMSLLNLQSFHLADPQARAFFKENQLRIRAMALVHERLYQSSNHTGVDFKEYVTKLAVDLFHAYRVDANTIRLRITVEDITLGVDASVPCGLIINELLLNCIKHAFPDGRRGTVSVSLQRAADQKLLLTVADDGVGLGGPVDFAESKSLGFSLVVALVEQLGGAIRAADGPGTRIELLLSADEARDAGAAAVQ